MEGLGAMPLRTTGPRHSRRNGQAQSCEGMEGDEKSGLLPEAHGCHRTTSRYEGRCAQRDRHRSCKDHLNRTGTPLGEKEDERSANHCRARRTEEREEAKREPKRRPVRVVRTVRRIGWSKRYVSGAGSADHPKCAVASAKPPGTYERVRIPAIEQGRAGERHDHGENQERPRQDFGAHGT